MSPDFSQFGPRRRVKGGIEARNRRGAFGSTWWGRALIDAVEELADAGRLSRGRTYARAGQVVAMQVGSGSVTAEVQGSQPLPFTSTLILKPLDDGVMAELIDTIRSTPGMLAAIAGGAVPQELGPILLPSRASELDFDCTCPDSGWPCKHVAAVMYLTAEHIDEHPLDILTLRGIELDMLISGVERETADDATTDPYGDNIELPALPRLEFRSALDDLDMTLLRRALRSVAYTPREVASALTELELLYGRLGADE